MIEKLFRWAIGVMIADVILGACFLAMTLTEHGTRRTFGSGLMFVAIGAYGWAVLARLRRWIRARRASTLHGSDGTNAPALGR